MNDQLSENTIKGLFTAVLQHAKCIEVRTEYAKRLTNKNQKNVLARALVKIKSAINDICDLLPDSKSVLSVKEELNKEHIVYTMLITEHLIDLQPEYLEDIVELIEKYLENKKI
jgi:hypothetical protein